MDWADAERAIIFRMQANWHETDLAIGNDEYEPTGVTEEFVRLWTRFGTANNAALGAAIVNGPGYIRHPGTIIVQLFVRPKTGTVRLSQLGAAVSCIFLNERFDGIRCYETSLIFASERTPDGWYQANATTFFEFEQRKTA